MYLRGTYGDMDTDDGQSNASNSNSNTNIVNVNQYDYMFGKHMENYNVEVSQKIIRELTTV